MKTSFQIAEREDFIKRFLKNCKQIVVFTQSRNDGENV